MASGLYLGRGSKRSVQRVRWKAREIASALLLLIFLSCVTVAVGIWVGTHHMD